MLRSKKFLSLKHSKMNLLFDFFQYEATAECLYNDDITSDISVRTNATYEIVKDLYLETYIFKLNDILVIHLKEQYLRDFEFLYDNSPDYLFQVYSSSLPDLNSNDIITTYHCFFVPKVVPDYMSFLKANDCDGRYACLACFYGPSVIMNRRFDIISAIDKYNCKYKFFKTIGKGPLDSSNLIASLIALINSSQETLPPHYLKIQ